MDVIQALHDIFDPLNTHLWYVAFLLLIPLGLYFTWKLKGMQVVKIAENGRLAVSGTKDEKGSKKLSSFEAFCIGLGAHIGVGNIAGVATAIVVGGPGAVFWMWVIAIIGAASNFVETTLAQIYKEKKSDGGFYGGPAYYATKAIGSKKVGIVLAVLTILCFGIGFVGVQAANVSSAVCNIVDLGDVPTDVVFGLIISAFTAVIILSGMKGIAKFSSKVVPIMALLWMIMASAAVCMNIGNLGQAFQMIFVDAFCAPESVVGGLFGGVFMTGLKRGVFSNESGLGSVANIAATADVKHPVTQGKIQCFGVLVDTLLVCTVTALVILTYGDYSSILSLNEQGSPLVQDIIASTAFGEAAKYIIAIFLCVFAFTSLIGYYSMSESNVRFIKDSKVSVAIVRVIVIGVTFVSCLIDTGLMDTICDTFMSLMGSMNMLIICILSPTVWIAYKDYRRQRKEGIKNPVFHKSVLKKQQNITEWGD